MVLSGFLGLPYCMKLLSLLLTATVDSPLVLRLRLLSKKLIFNVIGDFTEKRRTSFGDADLSPSLLELSVLS
jgi:hypothetical protein